MRRVKKIALGRMITGFITVIVGASLVPTLVTVINASVLALEDNGTLTGTTGSAASLLELTILFFALGVMIAGVGTSVSGLVEYGLV